jgi:hypothetical protein
LLFQIIDLFGCTLSHQTQLQKRRSLAVSSPALGWQTCRLLCASRLIRLQHDMCGERSLVNLLRSKRDGVPFRLDW